MNKLPQNQVIMNKFQYFSVFLAGCLLLESASALKCKTCIGCTALTMQDLTCPGGADRCMTFQLSGVLAKTCAPSAACSKETAQTELSKIGGFSGTVDAVKCCATDNCNQDVDFNGSDVKVASTLLLVVMASAALWMR